MYIIYFIYEKCLFIYFSKYLFQLFIILILLCSILHSVSHTILLLIILKLVFFYLRKLCEKMAVIGSYVNISSKNYGSNAPTCSGS